MSGYVGLGILALAIVAVATIAGTMVWLAFSQFWAEVSKKRNIDSDDK